MKNFSSKMSCVLLLSSVAFLPSCDWLKGKIGLNQNTSSAAVEVKEGEMVLATVDGKPLITSGEFEKQFKNLIETHPYGAMLAQMEGLDRRFLDGLVGQKLMTRYIEENGINKTAEYQQQLDALVQMLNARFFQMKHTAKVTEAEMRAFYDQNKENMPEAVMSRGGVNAIGVSFAKEADAKAFLEKAKGKGAMLEQLAKDAGFGDKYRDFKMVNAGSPGVDPILRDKIVALSKFPGLELIKGSDNAWYVIYASGKEPQKYRTFEELKGALEQRLTAKKQEEAMEKAVEQLKKDYKVEVKDEYFTKKAAGNAVANEVINDEQLEMVMPEAPTQESAQAKPAAKVA
jgi:hypothetical protein